MEDGLQEEVGEGKALIEYLPNLTALLTEDLEATLLSKGLTEGTLDHKNQGKDLRD